MRFENVSIQGLAYVDAPHRVTSAELSERLAPMSKRFDLKPDLLESLTGIVARRYWDEGVQPSHVAAQAAERALENAGVDRSKIGVLISTSVCKDYIEPSVASLVHNRLGLSPECLNFDLGNACLAFLNAMTVAGNMIERGQIDYALIVDGEGSRFIQDVTIERLNRPETTPQQFRDNFATLTLGSGAAAAVLARSDLATSGHRFLGGVSLAATQHSGLCRGQPDEMITDASSLLVAGLELAAQTYVKAKKELGWEDDGLDEYVLHQVSATHTAKLSEVLRLNRDKIHAIYPEFGNIGPASVPIVLAKSAELGRIKSGQRVGLLGIGSGLNCAMMEVVW